MYTQKKSPYRTYDKTTAGNRQRRKKQKRRRFHIKCILCVSVFTLSFIITAEWHTLRPQSDSWNSYSAKATTLFSSASGHNLKTMSGAPTETEQTNSQPPSDSQLPRPSSSALLRDVSDGQLQGERRADTTTDDTGTIHITSVSDEWNLILVNPWNKIPKDYDISLANLPNGQAIDYRCYPALTEMLAACEAAGLHPLICSSYRTQEKQESLFQERMDELTAQGYPKKKARMIAATSVARPGTSEHQLGLAVDIVDRSHQSLDASQEYTMVQQWLMENSWKYGFILRYPNDKSSLTGIIYEPWHYRYVGTDAARDIYERGLCLEEYLAELTVPDSPES